MRMPENRRVRTHDFRTGERSASVLGSDKRIRGGYLGRCVFCGNRSQLCLSHVIPKWAYKWHKADCGGQIHGMHGRVKRSVQQDGDKHYLLCRNCEDIASVAEAYVHVLSNGTESERNALKIQRDSDNVYSGFRFDLVVRFIAAVALRSHFASADLFRNIKFPLAARKLLRNAIFTAPSDSGALWFLGTHFIAPPDEINHDPRSDLWIDYKESEFVGAMFAVFAGGWEWYAVFSNDSELAKVVYEYRLKDQSKFAFPPMHYDIHRNIEFLYEDGKLKTS